jgi:hypothetical protein
MKTLDGRLLPWWVTITAVEKSANCRDALIPADRTATKPPSSARDYQREPVIRKSIAPCICLLGHRITNPARHSIFDLGSKDEYLEHELEEALIQHLEHFLLDRSEGRPLLPTPMPAK